MSADVHHDAAWVGQSPIPAYYRIAQTLRQRILRGTYPVAAQLPTEDELMREFAVSRHTVRAALQQLVIQGLVQRFPGRGSFVLERAGDAAHWAAQSLEEMIDRGLGEQLDVLACATLTAGAAGANAAPLQLAPDAPVVRIAWMRSGEDGPRAHCDVYLPKQHADRLPEGFLAELKATRLLFLVEKHSGVLAERVQQVASAVAAGAEIAQLLGMPPGAPLLSLRRTYFDRDGGAIECSHIVCRPDRCQQTVELFRRNR